MSEEQTKDTAAPEPAQPEKEEVAAPEPNDAAPDASEPKKLVCS